MFRGTGEWATYNAGLPRETVLLQEHKEWLFILQN